MPDRIRITDVSPRDGLQNEPGFIPTAAKVRLVEALCAAGVDEVEVTSFVSPKWVPQLADADDVLREVGEFADGVRHVSATIPQRAASSPPGGRAGGGGGGGLAGLPVFSVLVPNDKGFERALAVHRGAAGRSPMPLKIAAFTAASETFCRKNINASIAESIERFRAFIPAALDEGMAIRLYVSCAIACPFEGPIAPAAVRKVVDMLLFLARTDAERARLEIDLGDTIGVATTEQTEELLREFEPGLRERQITLHLHDTFGRAASCVRAALGLGIRSFDGSVAGLGGCPYASTPERRAPGNISTETLVRTIRAAGFDCGVDEAALAEAGNAAREAVAR
jgi:hydroxymethylglutaryl-CoA lyase